MKTDHRQKLLRLHRPARGERGQALVLAILVMLVLIIGATAVAGLVASNETNAGRERSSSQALSAGEGGLDLAANAVSTATAAQLASNAGVHYPASVDQYGYKIEYWFCPVTGGTPACPTVNPAYPSGSYFVNSSTTSPDGKVTRVLQEVIVPKSEDSWTQTSQTNPYTATTTSTSVSTNTTSGTTTYSVTNTSTPATFWGYGFVMGGSPHTGTLTPDQVCQSPSVSLPTSSFGGSGAISVPTWINGDVCITGGANPAIGNPPTGSAIPVHIGGSLYVNGPNYAIGTPTSKISQADITACWSGFGSGFGHGGVNVACSNNTNNGNNGGSGVYATSFTAGGIGVTPPTIPSSTENSLWSSATFGPKNTTCTTSGTLPANLFDNNAGSTTAPDTSLGLKNLNTLLGTTAFDCVSGTAELKWTPGAIGTLYVSNATVFFDANLTMAGADYIKLAPGSNGSIYVDGYFQLTNDASICAYYSGTTCTPATDGWSPGGSGSHATDPVVFFGVYNRSGQQYGVDLEGNSNIEGIVLTNGGFYLSNSAELSGSIFATYGTVNGAGTFLVTGSVPAGAIGGTTTTVSTSTSTFASTGYSTNVSTGFSTGTTTVDTGTLSTWTSSWNVAAGSWRQCPIAGCG
jgi:hypothetical protein